MRRNCSHDAQNGILDANHIEYRLDVIDARLDDLVCMIADMLERIDKGKKLK